MAPKIALIVERISAWFFKLPNREQRLVTVLGAATVLIALVSTGFWTASSFSAKETKISAERKTLEQITALETQYRTSKIKHEEEDRKFRVNNVSLFSLMQNIANSLELSIKNLSEEKTPVAGSPLIEYSVVVDLSKLSIDRLTAFLEAAENTAAPGLVKVTKLRIKTRFDNPQLLDVQMTVSTWKMK